MIEKQQRKLLKIAAKAAVCTSRKEAKKLLKKEQKAQKKLSNAYLLNERIS